MSDSTLGAPPPVLTRPCKVTPRPSCGSLEAALAPAPERGIARVTLIQVWLRWRNAFNQVTIRRADDLLACAELEGGLYDLMPKGAEIIGVILEFDFADNRMPQLVELRSPDVVRVPCPEDVERVLAFLTERGFITQNP
ncbi:MAG TPA: hypothetical protein VKY92_06440 [Verrucomicrobiae bacterium]|nr:hypothetical protein [Verrucomicrobiae bacterium]